VVDTIAAACPGLEIVQTRDAEPHEAEMLVLNTEKARRMLNWRQKFDSDEAIGRTVGWYRRYYEKKPMQHYTRQQIEEYMRIN
jgi:CDP-glucose 4,6-dehydratase